MSLVRFRPEAPVKYADLAHLVERHLAKVEVASSSLVIRSRKFVVEIFTAFLLFTDIFRTAFKRKKEAVVSIMKPQLSLSKNRLLKPHSEIYHQHRLKQFPHRQEINIFVSVSVQLH